jgi:hypothetical protein
MADEMSTNSEMSISVMRTPICHPKLAGEGIKYAWGCAKQFYQNLTIDQKQGVDKFRLSVSESLSRSVLTKERIRKFSLRARRYILSYYVFENLQALSAAGGNTGLGEINHFLKEEGERPLNHS